MARKLGGVRGSRRGASPSQVKVAELSNESSTASRASANRLHAGFAGMLPPTVILSLIGYPEGHAAEFRELADNTLHVEEAEDVALAQVSQATIAGDGALADTVFALIPDLVQERLDNPQDDLISEPRAFGDHRGGRHDPQAHDERDRGVRAAARPRRARRPLPACSASPRSRLPARNPDQRQLLVDDPSLLNQRCRGAPALRGAVAGAGALGEARRRGARGCTIPAGSKMGLLNAVGQPRRAALPRPRPLRRAARHRPSPHAR